MNTKTTPVKQPLNARSTIRTEQNRTEQNRTIVPEWIDKEIWTAFLEMRKGKRSTPTPKAVELLIKELEKLKSTGNDPNKVLQQSVMNSWKGVFPLKDGDRSGAHQQDARRAGTKLPTKYTEPLPDPRLEAFAEADRRNR